MFPNYLHGYADHTFCNDSYNALISVLVSLNGMTFLEKHVTTNFLEKRIDWESAISISKFNEISDMLNLAKKINGTSKLELNKKGKLKGKTFMFTGKLINISRAEAKSLVEKNSGNIVSTVNKKLNFLVFGEKPTNKKIELAKKIGVKVLNQQEWVKLLN